MDGTLWDSAAEVAESWNETVKRAGYDRKPITVKDIQSVMGKTMDVIARILFPDLEEGERQKLLAQCGEEENDYLRIHGATLYPDIRRTMEQLYPTTRQEVFSGNPQSHPASVTLPSSSETFHLS